LAHCGNFRPGNPAKKTEKLFSIQMQSTTCIFFFINILCDIGCSADLFSTKEGLPSASSGRFLPTTLLWTIDYRLWMLNLSVQGMPPGSHHTLWHKPCGKFRDAWHGEVEKIFSINTFLCTACWMHAAVDK
jgi:hypothetical protein